MAEGKDYGNDKDALLNEGIADLVFKNGRGAIDGENNQKALKNIVETLWDQGGGSLITEFTGNDGNTTMTISREITGSTLRLSGKITASGVATNATDTIMIPNVIPQGLTGWTWARVKSVIMVCNETHIKDKGFLVLDELSTYSVGSREDDETVIFLAGNEKGLTRAYNIDGFNQNSGTGLGAIIDKTEGAGVSDNYITSSPSDLREHSVSVGYRTLFTQTGGENNSPEVDVSFMIEFDLLK